MHHDLFLGNLLLILSLLHKTQRTPFTVELHLWCKICTFYLGASKKSRIFFFLRKQHRNILLQKCMAPWADQAMTCSAQHFSLRCQQPRHLLQGFFIYRSRKETKVVTFPGISWLLKGALHHSSAPKRSLTFMFPSAGVITLFLCLVNHWRLCDYWTWTTLH